MFHFISNLIGYLMISIESAWNVFWEELNRAKSFDQILKLQENLVSELIEITLNTPKARHANTCLSALFSSILNFSAVEKELVTAYCDYSEK
jgi:hypothetical protein